MDTQDQIVITRPKVSHFYVWMLIGSYICSVLPFIALIVLFETIKIDFDGTVEEQYKPYETLIDIILVSGLIAIPVGFGLGICCFFSPASEVRISSIPPTLLLGILLVLFIIQYCSSNSPATTPPVLVEIYEGKQ